MTRRPLALLLSCASISAPVAAQQAAEAVPAPVPVTAQSPARAAAQRELPPEEEKIRVGIVLLAGLHDILSKVRDKDSAEAAVAPIMRFSSQLQEWGHSFNALPPLSEEIQERYERRYLPIIDQLNTRLQAQADRLASAEFYGSRNLPAALVQLVASFQ